MHIYLDSTIIFSQYIENDQFKAPNQLLLSQLDLNFITGFITLIEIKALIHRLWQKDQIIIEDDFKMRLKRFSESIQIQRVFDYCIQKIHCEIISLSLQEHIDILETSYETGIHCSLAYRLGSILDLKALDLLQIATAMNIKLYGKRSIDYFLTNDKMILTNGKTIRRTTNIQAVSSEELIKVLKIT